jgi:hypothetical protein
VCDLDACTASTQEQAKRERQRRCFLGRTSPSPPPSMMEPEKTIKYKIQAPPRRCALFLRPRPEPRGQARAGTLFPSPRVTPASPPLTRPPATVPQPDTRGGSAREERGINGARTKVTDQPASHPRPPSLSCGGTESPSSLLQLGSPAPTGLFLRFYFVSCVDLPCSSRVASICFAFVW